jgi:gamma-tubulin complex component 2
MENVTKTCGKLQENSVRGGNVLTYLHDSIALFSGDKNSQQILIHLTQKAAEPYMDILRMWLFKGIITDPRNEFFVEENELEVNNPDLNESNDCYYDFYWEKRYVIKADKVPRFLEKQANIILRTGKYLNVIRDCGKSVTFNQSHASLKFSHTDEQRYMNLIDDAYSFASKSLMEVVMDEHDMMGHLLSVKRYFLLQQGDFIVQFMDACEGELMKNVDDVIPSRLESLLELTLRLSSAKHDKYQDNLTTVIMSFDILTQMTKIFKTGECSSDDEEPEEDNSHMSKDTGIDCFCFGYKINWPINILLNQMTMSKYQIIFRQLFYCKYVENFLCRVWIANNNAKKFDHETSEQYRSAFTLRQRMMNAIQNLEYYMMIEVIEPYWHTFMQQITKAKNIDDVITYHDDFLDNCLKHCMLQEQDVLKFIIQMCHLCIDFCEFIEVSSFLKTLKVIKLIFKYVNLFVWCCITFIAINIVAGNHTTAHTSFFHKNENLFFRILKCFEIN